MDIKRTEFLVDLVLYRQSVTIPTKPSLYMIPVLMGIPGEERVKYHIVCGGSEVELGLHHDRSMKSEDFKKFDIFNKNVLE